MLCSVHGRLGAARIHHDNGRVSLVPQHSLPQDRMGDTRIGADEHEHVRFFEVCVSEWWRVEAEALLVSHVCRSHALARV